MTVHRVGYLVGSLSSESINRVLSKALVRLTPPHMQMTEIPVGDLPLYNRDLDADYPRRRRPSRTPSPASTPCCS